LDDLNTELELADEDELVLYARPCFFLPETPLITPHRYKIGESFLHIPHARALARLEKDQVTLDSEIRTLSERVDECEKEMKELKTLLYGKFGSAINLDE
jgi:prefoldin subunit 4